MAAGGGAAGTPSGGTGGGDACAGVTCSDHGTCSTSTGTAVCACNAGYAPATPTTCVDVDECFANNGGCDSLTVCNNLPGSVACGVCPPGYDGTGATGCVPHVCTGAPDPSCACIRVTFDGSDTLGEMSGGVMPFETLQGAVDFADGHRSHATSVCVAEGTTCGSLATYSIDSALSMRNGISVYGAYESTNWTRCSETSPGTSLVSSAPVGVFFGSDIAAETAFDGFRVFSGTTAVMADGALGARLSHVELNGSAFAVDALHGANVAVTDATLDAQARAVGATLSLENSRLQVSLGAPAGAVYLEDAPGSRVLSSELNAVFSQGALSEDIVGIRIVGDADDIDVDDNLFHVSAVSSTTGIAMENCSGTPTVSGNDVFAENHGSSGSAAAMTVTGACEPLIEANLLVSAGVDGIDNTALTCAASCIVRDNPSIRVEKTGSFDYPQGGSPPPRGTVMALSCSGCQEISANVVTNYVPRGPLSVDLNYRRDSGYVVTGAAVSGATLVARNDISSGCGQHSVGMTATGGRVENNVITGGCVYPGLNPRLFTSVGLRTLGLVDVHSNLIGSPSPGPFDPLISEGLQVYFWEAVVRNNIIGGHGSAIGGLATGFPPGVIFQNNDVLPGFDIDAIDAATLNAQSGSSGNFEAYCPGPHITAASPCRDMGTPTGAPSDDFDGEPRDSLPDVGPDEWSAAHDPFGANAAPSGAFQSVTTGSRGSLFATLVQPTSVTVKW